MTAYAIPASFIMNTGQSPPFLICWAGPSWQRPTSSVSCRIVGMFISMFSPPCFSMNNGELGYFSLVYYNVQVLTMPTTFSVPAASRKEESWVLKLLSGGLKWLIEINLKWHCRAQQFMMAIFIYLTILYASCMKRLPWEMTPVYWLLF